MPATAFFVTTLLFSCSIPESLTMKTSEVSYEIPLGNTEVELAKKFSAETIQDALSSDDESEDSQKIYAYEFNPTKKDDAVLEYVMNYPLKSHTTALPATSDASSIVNSITPNNDGKYEYDGLDSFTDTLDTGINFKEILESIAGSSDEEDATDYSYIFDKIKFGTTTIDNETYGIEAYAYIECESVESANAYFTGKIVVGETDPANVNDASTYVSVLADSDQDGDFHLVTTDTDLSSKADEEGVITDGSFRADGAYSVALDGDALTDYMNGTEQADGTLKKHEKFIISCNLQPIISFDSKEELQSFLENTESLTVNINIILRIPLVFEVTDDIEIDDLLDLAGNALDEDLFKRDDGEEFEFKKYTDLLQALSCEYKFSNSTGLGLSAKIVSNEITDGEKSGKFFDDKEIKFDGEEHEFEFTTEEFTAIFETAPFMPKMYMKIDKTDGNAISIKRNSVFGAYALFKLTAEGEVEVWSK